MKNWMQWIITCRFPGWEQNGHEFSSFGVKYLLKTKLIGDPDWEDDDERWMEYDPLDSVALAFIQQQEKMTGKEFNGEILFIEPVELTLLDATVEGALDE